MNSHQSLFRLISSIVSIDTIEQKIVTELFEPVTYPGKELLESENRITRNLYFINSGFVRVFQNLEGSEITTHINCPPGFITSFNSFISSTPALDNVETITSCELLRITKNDLDALFSKDPKWAAFGRIITDKSLAYNEQRTNDMLTLPAEQRYLKLIANYPEIVQNVPLRYISSYLGIEPQSLSRIRRKIIS
jgi:CRP-like cAMP-binding protein